MIGDGHPCFIIAEAGSNHNRSLATAKKLVDAAAASGADAVKFQLFRADKLYVKDAGSASYLKTKKPIYNIMKEAEMPYEWISALHNYCKKKNIIFLASVFDEESLDTVKKFVPALKIGSYELTHLPLLEHAAKTGKPIILSTAMGSDAEIEEAVTTIKNAGNKKIALMHCIASYPAPVEVTNLNAIKKLKERFNVPVGLSDHSKDPIIIPVAAVSAGAKLIEKHFTLDRKMKGPDHKFATEPDELKAMVVAVRTAESAFMRSKEKLKAVEKELCGFARRGIFSTKNIKKGEIFTKNNISVLRSGVKKISTEPREFHKIIGNRAKRNINAGDAIRKGDY